MSNNFHLQLYRGTTAQNDAYTGLSGEVTVDTTLSKLRLHDGSTKGGVEIGGMPVGSIIPYAGTTIPAGYLLCDGSAISRTTYGALFASIGTTYGEGDGNSTFNIPNTNERYLKGNNRGYGAESLPNIKGNSGSGSNVYNSSDRTPPSGAFAKGSSYGNVRGGTEVSLYNTSFNASRSSSTYKDNAKVNPDHIYVNFVIKY